MEVLQNIFKDCDLHVQRYEPVHGGDINLAYCLFTSTGKYFLKINDKNKYTLMFTKEANGLRKLQELCTLKIPRVIREGSCYDQQYLLLEWLEKGSPKKDMWENFGSELAMMHKQPKEYFGFNENNYIGSLEQNNDPHNEWHSFYSECRIKPLVKKLFDAGDLSTTDIRDADLFCNSLRTIFPGEPPSFLHGDLWAGNYMITASGYAAMYDPSVYFGNREMDMGMTKLFGGFDRQFYEAYNETYPLQKGWENRLPITQLYPLLVHAVLFGGHYISDVKHIFSAFR
ncbi:MAG: fructosamine kinase family protein [Bacteroidetes bacterium]|nr:MAG: fructosamine kinase family protein [Bacteroidota bacterium]